MACLAWTNVKVLTNVISPARRRAHVLMPKEGYEVDLGALVLPRLAVDARTWRLESLVSVQVKGSGLIEDSPSSLFQLLQLRHCFGEDMAGEGGHGETGRSEELHVDMRWRSGRDAQGLTERLSRGCWRWRTGEGVDDPPLYSLWMIGSSTKSL